MRAATATPEPLFTSRVVRAGTDATVLAYGPTVKTALKCAEAAESEGRSLEVIDLRTLSPLDMGPVFESVRRTGRCVITHEAHVNLGMGAEVAARITEQCFYSLEAPVLRVGGFDTPYPASRIEEEYLPDLDRGFAELDGRVLLDRGGRRDRSRVAPPEVAGERPHLTSAIECGGLCW